jgi:two-component system, OmpR family, phosphate regulon sensor histidine kinase PhoR
MKAQMHKRSIFFKIYSGYILTALGVALLMLFFSYGTIKKHYINTLTNDLKDLCAAVNPQTLYFLKSSEINALDKFIKNLSIQTHKRLTVIDINGVVLADSQGAPETMANHKTRPEVVQVLNGSTGTAIRYSSTVQENMLYVAVPVFENNKIIGVLRASV